MIKKHSIACTLHPIQQSQRHIYFQFRNDPDEAREGFYMTRKNWVEMGGPRVITVTVESGDKTGDESHEQNLLDKIPSRIPKVDFTVNPAVPPVSPT